MMQKYVYQSQFLTLLFHTDFEFHNFRGKATNLQRGCFFEATKTTWQGIKAK